jgi:hypothetical protein
MKTEFTKVRLSPEEKKYLMEQAKRLNTSVSSLIRNYVATNPQPINPQKI